MKIGNKLSFFLAVVVAVLVIFGCVTEAVIAPDDGTPKNLALNKKTDSSSVEKGGLEGEMAVDGDMETRWSSEFSDPNWLSVDLGAKYKFMQVVCRWEAAFGEGYKIQTSDDGKNYKDVFARAGFEGGDDVIDFPDGIQARYVRVYGESRGTPYGYSLFELEVYNVPFVVAEEAKATPKPTENRDLWVLDWSDEFNGAALDTAVWTNETGAHGWGNGELQNYTTNPENCSIIKDDAGNSVLQIQALKTVDGAKVKYSSARIKTQGKKSFQYGKIEARLKMPYGQGIWPAFWMLGDKFSSIGWPGCGEVDIVEMVGGVGVRDSTALGTIHYKDASGGHGQSGLPQKIKEGKLADAYHVYGIEWTKESIKWFLDGVQFSVEDITAEDRSELQDPFFLILNLAVGGGWPGNPDATTVFPQKLYADYIRVYKSK